jgi:hypothetical protein
MDREANGMESANAAGTGIDAARTQKTTRPLTPERTTEIVIGALILTATTSYLVGSALIDSAVDQESLSNPNETQLVTGALLEFVNAAAVVGIGVLLFPILRRYREGMALGYAATRIIESALLLVSALFVLVLLPLNEAADAAQLQATGTLALEGYDVAFQLAEIALGAGSLLFMYILYAFRLVPRALSLLGFVGYVALFASGWLEIAGHSAALLYIPGGLFELLLPLWLIFRGFNAPAVTTRSADGT